MKKFVDKHLFDLVNLKKRIWGNFAKKYFSQSGEDIIVERLFTNKKSGVYVDVGAYHPEHYSNTHLLYKKGWSGVNIDPNPKSIRLFDKSRKRDINICCGVSDKEGFLTYYVFNHQSCNTFSEEQKEEILQRPYVKLIDEIEVPCLPLQKILQKELEGQTIDLLSVDTEGYDLEVLKTNDWSRFRPQLIIVENEKVDFDQLIMNPIYAYLKEKGYILHAYTGLSMIFKIND